MTVMKNLLEEIFLASGLPPTNSPNTCGCSKSHPEQRPFQPTIDVRESEDDKKIKLPPKTGLGVGLRQTDRSALRRRMTPPVWEKPQEKSGRWNAHHVIPWEFLYHQVFNILRKNGGWDHNALLNSVALPTVYNIKGAKQLPVHQYRAFIRRGHPEYNQRVKKKLDELLDEYKRHPNPIRLRHQVTGYIISLKRYVLVSSKAKTLAEF